MFGLKKIFSFNDFMTLFSFCIFIILALFHYEFALFSIAALICLCVAISTAVSNAEIISRRLGPAIGALILALSVTIIELALILSLMHIGGSSAATIARDTVFATVMIVANGLIGVSILLSGLNGRRIRFHALGAAALLSVLAVLIVLTFILPNFTTSSPGPTYDWHQLIFISVASIILYVALVLSQTISQKEYFHSLTKKIVGVLNSDVRTPSNVRVAIGLAGLILSLVTVVGLSKLLAPTIESVVLSVGAPKSVVGIFVAFMILAPETLAAINAAKTNHLQASLNLALGSGIASIALTIPIVSIYSIVTHSPLTLGLSSKSIVFFAITMLASCFTFSTGFTTRLNGFIHIVILASYIALAFMP